MLIQTEKSSENLAEKEIKFSDTEVEIISKSVKGVNFTWQENWFGDGHRSTQCPCSHL